MHYRKNYTCDLLLLSVATVWGLNFAVIKLVYRTFHPIAFNAVRFAVATLLMMFFLKVSGKTLRIDRKDKLGIFGLAVVSVVCYQFLFVLGIANTRAGNAALIMATAPVLAYLFGIVQRREQFNGVLLTGIILSVIGVGAIVFFGSSGMSFGQTWKGDLLMFGASTCWAWYTANATPYLTKYGALRLTLMTMVIGTTLLIPLSVPWLIQQNWQDIPAAAWAGLLYSTALAIVFCGLVWAWALGKVGVARTAVFQNVTPIVALIAGWGLLSERPSLIQTAGVLLALAGVFIVRSRGTAAAILPGD